MLEKLYVVYAIRCRTSGKCYIGSTCDDVARMNAHWGMLKRGTHHSIKLQRAYNKYGDAAFDFVLCEVEVWKSHIASAERFWIDKMDSFHNGYNMTDAVEAGQTLPLTQIIKMTKAAQEVGTRPEVRKGRSERAKLQHVEGRIGRREVQSFKFKNCKNCGKEFELQRNPKNGAWKENKLCDSCAANCRYSTRK